MNHFFLRSQVEMFPETVQATVEQRIAPNQPGRVKFLGSYWPAKLYKPDEQIILEPSQRVLAVGIEGITLLIVPE